MSSINANFRVCALLGHPVGHSLSPALHNAGFQELGLPFVYVAHDVAPAQLRQAIEAARVLGYRGLSITIPHKVAALDHVDDVEKTARAIGCINTVVIENGRLLGYNSDGLGALNALKDAGADPNGRQVAMLGSGGAARAIAMTLGLEAKPARLVLLGTERDELEKLTRDLAERTPLKPVAHRLSDETLAQALGDADLVLQCTPVGMHPDVERSLVPPALLRPSLTIFDAVYNPRQTRLLRDAKAAGCKIVEGAEMFLGQARVQFELWTGKPAPAQTMRRILEEKL